MTYEIRANEQFGSLEVFFEGKPGDKIREALKGLKFRWNPRKMCWYGYGDKATVEAACNGAKAEKATAATKASKADKDEQKRLFDLYMNIIKNEVWKGSEKMQEYARKSTQYIVELKNGNIIALDKPRIETSFCFGYGMYLQSTQEDEERASNMEHYARTNEQYFIDENLKGLNEQIEALRNESLKCYTFTSYYGQPENSKLKTYSVVRLADSYEWTPGRYADYKDLAELDTEDRERIAAGLEKVKEDFTKRLNTYLKKYGLTKLKTWTYLVD